MLSNKLSPNSRLLFLACSFILITYCKNVLSGTNNPSSESDSSRISKFEFLSPDVKIQVKDLPKEEITIPSYKMFDNSFIASGVYVYATSKTPRYYLAYIFEGLAKLDTGRETIPDNATIVIYDFNNENGRAVPRHFTDQENATYDYRGSNLAHSRITRAFYADVKAEDRLEDLGCERYNELKNNLPELPSVFSEWLKPPAFQRVDADIENIEDREDKYFTFLHHLLHYLKSRQSKA
jgi:hypothetical protein